MEQRTVTKRMFDNSGRKAVQMLISTMDDQRQQALILLELLIRERQAVLDNDVECLNEVNSEKITTLEDFRRLDKERMHWMAELAGVFGMEPTQDTTVRQIIEYLDYPYANELDKARSMLKTVLLQVKESNKTNRTLMTHCLQLVDKSVMMIGKLVNPPTVYGEDGSSRARGQGGILVSNVA